MGRLPNTGCVGRKALWQRRQREGARKDWDRIATSQDTELSVAVLDAETAQRTGKESKTEANGTGDCVDLRLNVWEASSTGSLFS